MLWDGLIEAIFSCENSCEIFKNNNFISSIYTKLQKIENAETIFSIKELLVFSKEEVNYLNSHFLDELYYIFYSKKDYLPFYTEKMYNFLKEKKLNIRETLINAVKDNNLFCVKIILEKDEINDDTKRKIFEIICSSLSEKIFRELLKFTTSELRDNFLLYITRNYTSTHIPLIKILKEYGINKIPLFYKDIAVYEYCKKL